MLQQFNERNRDLLVNINGSLVHRDQAGISPFDSAVQNGDAVWEGLRLYNGRIFKLIEHLDRLRHSAVALAYAHIPSHETIITEIRRTLQANQMTDNVHIRLTLTRGVKYTSGMDPRVNTPGSTLIVLAEHKAPVYDKHGIRLITSAIRRIPPECLDQKIHSCNMLNSILAKIQANAAGVDDALMLDLRGYVAETNATHLFIVENGVVMTSTPAPAPKESHAPLSSNCAKPTASPTRCATFRWSKSIVPTRSSAPAPWVNSPRWSNSTVAPLARERSDR